MSKKEPRSAPFSRPPLERMLRIHQSIHGGKYPNASTLAREMEVSTKSIHRDMEFMRDRLQLPLKYDSRRNGYHYTEEVNSFPTLQITEGELFSLVVAEKAVQQYRGTSFEKPLLSALKKMAASLPDHVSVNLEEWHQTISFRTSAEPIIDLAIFNQLSKAVSHRQQLEIQYRKPGHHEVESRLVDPYHLANINGEWFLFGFDHLRKDVRTFAPSRILSAKSSGKSFPTPKNFSIDKRLRHSFGVRSDSGVFEVRIEFAQEVADYIREKKWHASQVLRDLPDGGVELQLKLSGLSEIQRWILSWGGKARVLSPPELIRAIHDDSEQLLKKHSKF